MKLTALSRRTKLSAVIVAATTFLAGLGGVPAVAAWTSSATATSTASAPTVTVTQSGFSGLTATYLNSALTSTGNFTIKNTGGIVGNATVAVTTSGDLAAALPVQVWQVANAASCTVSTLVPDTAMVGTWASFPELEPIPLAAAASTTLCVRTTVTDRNSIVSETGSQTVKPSIAASLTAGGWTATATATVVTQATKAIYPVATGYLVDGAAANWFAIKSGDGRCLDVSASGVAVGTIVQSYTCNNSGAQRFEIVPIPDSEFVTFRPKSSGLLNVAINASNKTVLAAPNEAAPEQQWRIDRVSATTYQIVSAKGGLCFAGSGGNAQAGVAACSGVAVQTQSLPRDTLTCQSNGAVLTVSLSVPSNPRTYSLQYRLGEDPWTSVGAISITATAFNVTFPTTDTQTYDVRLVDERGSVIYSGMSILTDSVAQTAACGTGWI